MRACPVFLPPSPSKRWKTTSNFAASLRSRRLLVRMSTAKYGDLDLAVVPHATNADEFLQALNLVQLLPQFTAKGVTTIEHLLHLLPSDIDAMGIRAGVRVRLLKGFSLLREHHGSASNMATDSGTSTPHSDEPSADAAMEVAIAGVEAQRYNSTSSLYIQSTISHPDMAQVRARPSWSQPSPPRPAPTHPPPSPHPHSPDSPVWQICFCVSLLVHDLIQEAEASRRSGDDALTAAKTSPFSLFQPRGVRVRGP